MIHSIQFTSGYSTELKFLGTKTFKFIDGINVLYGENSCGKTTILKTLATYGLTRSRWSNLNWEPFDYPSFLDDNRDVNNLAKQICKNTANVEIDGAVFYSNNVTDTFLQQEGWLSGVSSMDFESAIVTTMNSKVQSSGYNNLAYYGKELAGLIQGDLSFSEESFEKSGYKCKNGNSSWRPVYASLSNYAKATILKGGKPTILLDEPDENLDCFNRDGLYRYVIPAIAKKYQVILSSHYCLLPFYKDYHFIDMTNSVKGIKKLVSNTINGN